MVSCMAVPQTKYLETVPACGGVTAGPIADLRPEKSDTAHSVAVSQRPASRIAERSASIESALPPRRLLDLGVALPATV
jgi:hypothetical protein